MARSDYVYVVLLAEPPAAPLPPVAAFTVKHELRTWLRRRLAGPLGTLWPESSLDVYAVYRVPDAGTEGTRISIPDILAGRPVARPVT